MTRASEESRNRETVETHTLTQAEAYTRLRRWAAQTYNSANDVIQMDDPASGTLVLKGVASVPRLLSAATIPVGYTLTLDIRDGRIRFTERIGSPTDSDAGATTESDVRGMRAELDRLRASAMASLTGVPASDF